MDVTYLGHACFLITGETGKKIIIDPFISENPLAPMKVNDINVDLIVVTHGHFDHLGDAVELANKCDCPIVAVVELANYCQAQGAKVHPMQIGGSFDFGFVKVKLTLAFHSSSILSEPAQYMGNPAGVLLYFEERTLYHAGDTALFGDMGLIGALNNIDVAMVPIGDNFTMGPADAIEALKLLRPKVAIPMHYNTWDIINQTAESFERQVELQTNVTPAPLKPGETYIVP
ncbi:MAG: metal-dependent hydrolase [Bacillota bacterium]|nr:metal-dependent hydrolase [Bacillota bacterium]